MRKKRCSLSPFS